MPRDQDSHKGENGKIAVIGGSRHQHGAPVFCALAAEAAGADLIFVCVPRCHEEVAKTSSLNFQVHPFGDLSEEPGDEMSPEQVESVLSLLATMDCAVIGPGLSRTRASLNAIERIIAEAPCPLVIDASALQPSTLKCAKGKPAVLTPHLGELERMQIEPGAVADASEEYGATFLVKSRIDKVYSPDGSVREIIGGNSGLTVGGTGDALAGLVAGLMAQGNNPADACYIASRTIKWAGDMLIHEFGFGYGTRRVIESIPRLLWELSSNSDQWSEISDQHVHDFANPE